MGTAADKNGRQPTVLVVGDAARALTRTASPARNRLEYCGSMLDAMALAAEREFAFIYVVMSGFDKPPEAELKLLRQISPASRIVLLAEMHEEASARQLIRDVTNAARPADAYQICPVDHEIIASGNHAAFDGAYSSLLAARDERIRQLEKLAMEDDLTGLKNRRYVRQFLHQILDKARRESFEVTLLVFDIDDFKRYNDVYGHAVGDNVLRQTAIMMRRCCRHHDVTGRIGGDEFAFVFWDCRKKDKTSSAGKHVEPERRHTVTQHPREAVFMAERFRKEVSSAELSFLGPEGKGILTISGGLASYPKDAHTVDSLFEQADKALLEAKRSGKNQITLVGSSRRLPDAP
ncbi:MAG TPA: GGDEF domain-containing protein [Anaerohalosphaeraceae bacterium]|jgi:diguanylate cyclase (GGDEF)-like protein|nr:GGDEF domain-containing protein [Anaerohalosphaeraceae bacterium]HRT50793.1 GGDEF domain-containing protein [Anaerohalosphaeraceae bacterium]HRT86829.1 GGDEF domain-containing protein [Anaerohalosphaeraceae bacterium]